MLSALAATLTVQGYVRHLGGPSSEPLGAAASHVPEEVLRGGPVIDNRGGLLRTASPASGTVALTFDDGISDEVTPAILDELADRGLTATFFVTGTDAVDHAELVRRIVNDGHELGLSTLTGSPLSVLPEWRRHVELEGAHDALAGTTQRTLSLVRPPSVSAPEDLTDVGWSSVEWLAGEGYLSVLATADSATWRPGSHEPDDASPPPGEVLRFLAGDSERAATLADLRRTLDQLDAHEYRVTSVGAAVGIESAREATLAERLSGGALVWGIRLSDVVVWLITAGLVIAGAVMLTRAVLVVAFAARHHRAARRRDEQATRQAWIGANAVPMMTEPVTVIVPAYNEAAGIEAAVRSIAASRHEVEIIVVDDGSTDDTADIVEGIDLPEVRLIRKDNGGKPSALNAGIDAASHELIVMVDGDTVFEPETVGRLIQPFTDQRVGAISGNTKVANRGGVLGAWQHIEYVVGFNLDRRLFDLAECMPTVPGAIGAFRANALRRAGGVSNDTLAEDTDLTMTLCRDGWRVVYEDSAIAWTEAPATLGALWKQRYRWCYGTLQAMWKHRGAVLQRGAAGKLGRRGLSYLLILQVLLPLFAPVVDVFAIYGLLFLDPLRIAGLWFGFLLLQVLMAGYAFRLDRERLKPLWTLPLQQVVYRQLMYLVVIQSIVTALAGVHLRWHRMERYGSLSAARPGQG